MCGKFVLCWLWKGLGRLSVSAECLWGWLWGQALTLVIRGCGTPSGGCGTPGAGRPGEAGVDPHEAWVDVLVSVGAPQALGTLRSSSRGGIFGNNAWWVRGGWECGGQRGLGSGVLGENA